MELTTAESRKRRRRVIVTGASGMVGANAVIELSRDNDVFATSMRRHVLFGDRDSVCLDITDGQTVSSFIRDVKPDVVMHCAAMASVEECEAFSDAAVATNVNGTRNVAEACAAVGAAMVFVSTAGVFDGTAEFYRDSDAPKSINTYARTKIAAERVVEKIVDRRVILRASPVGFAPQGARRSFVDWLLHESLLFGVSRVYVDAMFNPTCAWKLARRAVELIDAKRYGTFHVGCDHEVSKAEFADQLLSRFGHVTALNQSLCCRDVHRTKRPMRTVLSRSPAVRSVETGYHDVIDGLAGFVADGRYHEIRSCGVNDAQRVFIVIPVHDEMSTIRSVIDDLLGCKTVSRIKVVDDCSSDETYRILRSYDSSRVDAIRMSHCVGYDRAIAIGIKSAYVDGADVIVTCDGDGQHRMADVVAVAGRVLDGASVALGVRDKRQRWSDAVIECVGAPIGIDDPMCGIRAYRNWVFDAIGTFGKDGWIGTCIATAAALSGFEIDQRDVEIVPRNDRSRFGVGLAPNLKILSTALKIRSATKHARLLSRCCGRDQLNDDG